MTVTQLKQLIKLLIDSDGCDDNISGFKSFVSARIERDRPNRQTKPSNDVQQ